MKKWYIAIFIFALLPYVPIVAFETADGAVMTTAEECEAQMGRPCNCWELGSCQFVEDPLSVMLLPFDNIFGGLSIVIFWGVLVGILWLRTESPQLVGIIGISMVSDYMYYLEESQYLPSTEFETARVIGSTLIVVSLGIAVYQLIINRILQGPQ